MDKIYAPWRDRYVTDDIKGKKNKSDSDCVFCDIFRDVESAEKHFVLLRKDGVVVLLNLYPYNGGHLLILPEKHEQNMYDLSDEDQCNMTRITSVSMKIIQDTLRPEGMNFGSNLGRIAGAGIPQHLHWHIVPRWQGDTGFLTTIGETKQVSVDLQLIYKKLKSVFDERFFK